MERAWLIKSEPDSYSFEDLQRDGKTGWDGVRNYQARNFMRDDMKPGDKVFFYHSSTAQPAIVGIAEVAGEPYPDPTQFDPNSHYYDPKSTPSAPRWQMVDFKAIAPLPRVVTLAELKEAPELVDMRLLARGNRLSVMPVDPAHFAQVVALAEAPKR